MEANNLQFFSYKITGNPLEVDNGEHYSAALETLLQKTYMEVYRQKHSNPIWLHELIEKYPNVPAFKNYLTVYYNLKGKREKAQSTNHWLVKKHPDYLFGKLNLAAEYMENGRLDEVPKVLGKTLDLQEIYPERKAFHITEFQAFQNISCHYLLKIGEFEAVKSRLELAEQVLGKNNQVILQLRSLLAKK